MFLVCSGVAWGRSVWATGSKVGQEQEEARADAALEESKS